jgi:hypothetical protein
MHHALGRRVATLAVASLSVAGIELAVAGAAGAQSPGAAFTDARCLTGDAWGAVLSINADNLAEHPVAHVSTSAGPYNVAVPPAGYSTLITALGNQITVAVLLSWSDATTRDLGQVAVARPGSCTAVAPVATAPPTTSCVEAIPPRDDCGAPAAPPVASVVPRPATATEARLDTGATLLALEAASAPKHQPPAPARPAAALPVTGSFPLGIGATGMTALVGGLALVVAGRRRRRVITPT